MACSNYEVSTATLSFLQKISKECNTISLPVARCLSYRLMECSEHRSVGEKGGLPTKCASCGTAWDPSSVKIRTKSRPVLRRNMRKLLAKEQHRPWLLTSKQKKQLKCFKRATTMLVFLCKVCGKKVEQLCPKDLKKQSPKASLSTLFSNKAVATKSKKKPVSSPAHVLLKKKEEKCVVQDLRKESSSVKRNRSLLKRVLIEEDTQKISSGGLHSFLSSLWFLTCLNLSVVARSSVSKDIWKMQLGCDYLWENPLFQHASAIVLPFTDSHRAICISEIYRLFMRLVAECVLQWQLSVGLPLVKWCLCRKIFIWKLLCWCACQ